METLQHGKYYHIYNRGNNCEELFRSMTNYQHFLRLYEKGQPSKQFSNLFNAYTKAFNKMYVRTGSLFEKPFNRIEITSDHYFRTLVVYIHTNPVHHGFTDDFKANLEFHSLILSILIKQWIIIKLNN